jgi:hypothetical protein
MVAAVRGRSRPAGADPVCGVEDVAPIVALARTPTPDGDSSEAAARWSSRAHELADRPPIVAWGVGQCGA